MMLSLLLLIALIATANGQFIVTSVYESTTCSGSPVGIYAASVPDASDCSAVACVSDSTNSAGYAVTCPSTLPSPPSDAVTIAVYDAASCAGNPIAYYAFEEGECVSAGVVSYSLTCSGGASYNVYTQADCKGTPETVNYQISSGCYSQDGVSASVTGCGGGSSSKCFHEETVITYNEQQLTLSALLAGAVPACAVPHVKHSDGVAIRTACSPQPLRLTPEHLVYSARGLLLASELRVGDSLFADLGEQRVCNITSVDAEAHQRYFGLNCENSVVLANGIKTSAFGVYHTVPTLWMKIASSLVGVKSASAWGDKIAAFLYDWSLI